MPITKSISSKANAKQVTNFDFPINPNQVVTASYTAVSTSGQTVINLSYAVAQNNTINFLLHVDGKLLTLGSSNDYTFTNVQSNNTSSQITLNLPLASGLNIQALYMGVVLPSASASSILTINATLSRQVNVIRLTSGTGTYIPTLGTKYFRVRMVGGGGAGGGSSTTAGNNGGTGPNGNSTTFGGIATANGGQGGGGVAGSVGGAGGTVALTTSSTVILVNQATGNAAGSSITGNASNPAGGVGAGSVFGGGGAGGSAGNGGGGAAANSGGGGGGAGGPGSGASGCGGGSGGYIEFLVYSNNSSFLTGYAYSIAGSVTGGTAGTSGFTGGNGAGGLILIEEYAV